MLSGGSGRERAIVNKARIIRLPVQVSSRIYAYTQAKRQLAQVLGREPTLQEIAKAMQIRIEKVRVLSQIVRQSYSLETLVRDYDSGVAQECYLKDEKSSEPSDAVDEMDRHKYVNDLLGQLNERERRIIELRYGFSEEKHQTLDSIGKEYGMTKERVRQIQKTMLFKS